MAQKNNVPFFARYRTALLLGAILIAVAALSYANQVLYRYDVPPGTDALFHSGVVDAALRGDYYSLFHYHALWHVKVLIVAALTKIPSLTLMAWMSPALLVTMTAAIFVFSKRFFGTLAAVTSAVLIGLLSYQPLQTLTDGGYPNVLAAGTVLPILIMLLENWLKAPRKPGPGILFVVGLGILGYSHHLTTLYFSGVLYIFAVCLAVHYFYKKRVPILTIIGGLVGLGILAIVALYCVGTMPAFGSLHDLAKGVYTVTPQFPFFDLTGSLATPYSLWPLWSMYPTEIGPLVVSGGIAGAIIAAAVLVLKPATPNWRIYLLLLIWAGVLTIGSRIESLGEPVRLARDLAFPLAILAGVFVHHLYAILRHNRMGRIAFWLLLAYLLLSDGRHMFIRRYEMATKPMPLVYHLAVDHDAVAYMKQVFKPGDTVIGFQSNLFLERFLPKGTVLWVVDPDNHTALLTHHNTQPLFINHDYLYLEYRRDLPITEVNDPNLIDKYLNTADVTLVKTFDQPEKRVSLFKINHDALRP